MPHEDKKEEKPKERKYFEVFGDNVAMLQTFKSITVFLVFIVIFLLIIVVRAVNKEPLVIRVDQLGLEKIRGVRNTQKITKFEVAKFTDIFITKFEEVNYYVYKETFADAFEMMTNSCRQKLVGELNRGGIEQTVREIKPKTKVKIESIEIKKDTPTNIIVEAKGNKQTTSYADENYFEEVIFAAELVLQKKDRSDKIPWGILVEDYKKEIFQKK